MSALSLSLSLSLSPCCLSATRGIFAFLSSSSLSSPLELSSKKVFLSLSLVLSSSFPSSLLMEVPKGKGYNNKLKNVFSSPSSLLSKRERFREQRGENFLYPEKEEQERRIQKINLPSLVYYVSEFAVGIGHVSSSSSWSCLRRVGSHSCLIHQQQQKKLYSKVCLVHPWKRRKSA